MIHVFHKWGPWSLARPTEMFSAYGERRVGLIQTRVCTYADCEKTDWREL